MQIKWSKTQNFDWEPGLSNSACLNYVKKSGSQLVPQNAEPYSGPFSRNPTRLQVFILNDISIGSGVFVGLTNVTTGKHTQTYRPTDHATLCVAKGRYR